MLPFFNTSGPCIPGEHYMIPPERRLDDVLALIEGQRFFTLHAGRQTGKTTSLMWLERHLEATGRWSAIWVDLQTRLSPFFTTDNAVPVAPGRVARHSTCARHAFGLAPCQERR